MPIMSKFPFLTATNPSKIKLRTLYTFIYIDRTLDVVFSRFGWNSFTRGRSRPRTDSVWLVILCRLCETPLGFFLRVIVNEFHPILVLINLWNTPTNKDKIVNTKCPRLTVENGFQNPDLTHFFIKPLQLPGPPLLLYFFFLNQSVVKYLGLNISLMYCIKY